MHHLFNWVHLILISPCIHQPKKLDQAMHNRALKLQPSGRSIDFSLGNALSRQKKEIWYHKVNIRTALTHDESHVTPRARHVGELPHVQTRSAGAPPPPSQVSAAPMAPLTAHYRTTAVPEHPPTSPVPPHSSNLKP
jgi:hypothetical protein